MKKIYYLLTIVFSTFILSSCSHTNYLSQYKVHGASVIFRTKSNLNGTAYSAISKPVQGTLGDIVSIVGTGISSEIAQKRLNDAVEGELIASQIGLGIKSTMIDYLNAIVVDSMAQNPEYIVETILSNYEIISSAAGLCAKASGRSRVIHRASGKIVWDDCESHVFNVNNTWLAQFGSNPIRSGVSVINAIKLNTLSDEELKKIVSKTAFEVGKEIGETMREDIAEMNK